jgi:predicted flap endonuclease-1-like 5' DNA nuclease
MSNIIEVEGIGEVYAKKLKEAGISTSEGLLDKGATPAGRDKIAKETGISHVRILRWVNHVDLFRIKGIETQYAELLEAAGVDTVPELAQRNPANLLAALAEVKAKKHPVRKLPSQEQVADWIKQAKKLPRVVTY